MSKETRLDEKGLAKAAKSALSEHEMEASQVIAGKPLPEGFVNPEIGKPGHYCLDPSGNYQPTWASLKIHKTGEDIPERQFFQNGKRHWRVQTGVWVDVPPEIINLLECMVLEEVEMDFRTANPLMTGGVSKVVNKIPRFSTSLIPSA